MISLTNRRTEYKLIILIYEEVNMKEEILNIAQKLYHNHLTPETATNLLLDLFNVSNMFIPVSKQVPPANVELLVKSPNGTIYISSWRHGYNIFSCQSKDEISFNWGWKFI